MIQALAWTATLAGWTAAWTIGGGHRHGWTIAAAASLAWLTVDAAFGIWAGVVASAVSTVIAARNWKRAH